MLFLNNNQDKDKHHIRYKTLKTFSELKKKFSSLLFQPKHYKAGILKIFSSAYHDWQSSVNSNQNTYFAFGEGIVLSLTIIFHLPAFSIKWD